jgi:hypothetical protein
MGNQSSGALTKQELKELETQTRCMMKFEARSTINSFSQKYIFVIISTT